MKIKGYFCDNNIKFSGTIIGQNKSTNEYDVLGKYYSHNQLYVLLLINKEINLFKIIEENNTLYLDSELGENELKAGYYVLLLIKSSYIYEVIKNNKRIAEVIDIGQDELESLINHMTDIMSNQGRKDYEIIRELANKTRKSPQSVLNLITRIGSVDILQLKNPKDG